MILHFAIYQSLQTLQLALAPLKYERVRWGERQVHVKKLQKIVLQWVGNSRLM